MSTELATANTEMSLANLSEEIQQKILAYSKRIQESAAISINKIRLDAKSYTFPDQTETQTFTGIIVGVKHANIYYKDEYQEGVTQSPVCLAVGDVACKDLTPNKVVNDPCARQCVTCPNFQWGSANSGRGKGKACAEYTLLAVYVPTISEDLFIIEQKKANSRNCDAYLNSVTSRFGSPLAVQTRFSIGEKVKWEQNFLAVDPVNVDLIAKLVTRMDEADAMLTAKVVDSYNRSQAAPAANDEPEVNPRQARSQ